MKVFFQTYGEWVYRGIVLLLLGGFGAGQLSQKYASKADIETATDRMQAELRPIRAELRTVNNQLQAQDKALTFLQITRDGMVDHETRLRALERGKR